MSQALAISAANLDAIEQNLHNVADELSGVIQNVNGVNYKMNNVEAKVESLNDEVKGLVKEIRETTIMTNARQNIMYNNDQIDKRFGYYDNVRRTTEAIVEAVEKSNITKSSLQKLREELIINNPNYWLAPALATIVSWLLDDRANAQKELNNALRLDNEKTSLFFALINLKYKRLDTSINWLNRYLSIQDPTNLDKDFVTILDLVATGAFGNEEKIIVLNKIKDWFTRLASVPKVRVKAVEKWEEYIDGIEDKIISMPVLEQFCSNVSSLKNNLMITSSYYHLLDDFTEVTKNSKSNKTINNILKDLIYNFEESENVYQSENLKNNLILQCNGNREEADRLYKKQRSIYDERSDLISLLSNIVIYDKEYKVSNETQKMALSFVKSYIKEALFNKNNKIYKGDINIKINNFETKTTDGRNTEDIKKDVSLYINQEFNDDGKDLIVTLLIVNIIGIIGIFITLKSKILSTILIALLVIGNLILFYKLHKRTKTQEEAKKALSKALSDALERITAEVIDYQNILIDDQNKFNELNVFLDNLKAEDFLNSNNERNIEIGD